VSRAQVAVIGAGQVGATLAQRLVERNFADVVLVDVVPGLAQGKALDLAQAAPLLGYDARILGTEDYSKVAGSQVAVITAGKPRQPGMDRMDLLRANADIVKGVVGEVLRHAPEACLVVVTNPLDVMTYLALRLSGKSRGQVCGMAGVLDSARLADFLAERLSVSVRDVQAMVLGGHGDSMVPLPSQTTIAGIPVTNFLSQTELAPLIERTRDAGAEIVRLLQRGSAFSAPSAAAAVMVESILKDEKRLLPASVLLEGEYGLADVCVGVPVKLGAGGVKDIIELALTPAEQAGLRRSAEEVRTGIAALRGAGFI
jgi:malate dehydrogenase